MSCLLAICGRYGDIMMAVPSIIALHDKYGEVDLLVSSNYASVSDFVKLLAPVNKIVCESEMCPTRDSIVTGMFMSSWSEKMLKYRFPGYDKYVNAAPNMAPSGTHMMSLIAYRCGAVSTVSQLPSISVPPHNGEKLVVHLGSSDISRQICLADNPFPEFDSVCIGLPNDPCPTWIGEDRRGIGFDSAINALSNAAIMIGSDSLFTHVSCLMGITTACIHTSQKGMENYSRGVYPTGVSMVAKRGMTNPNAVRKTILQISGQEIFNGCRNRQEQEGMALRPETG